jgi:hypothetical protein
MSATKDFFITAAATFLAVLFAGIALRAADRFLFKKQQSFEVRKEDYEKYENIEEDRDE